MRRESPKPTINKQQGDSNQEGVVSALHQMQLTGGESAEDTAKQQQPQPGPQVQQKQQLQATEVQLKVESRDEDMGRFAGSLHCS